MVGSARLEAMNTSYRLRFFHAQRHEREIPLLDIEHVGPFRCRRAKARP